MIVIALMLFSLPLNNVVVDGQCLCDQHAATLLEFYAATNGAAAFGSSLGWSASTTVCTWTGVTCVGADVAELNLISRGLTGTLPDSLSTLTSLTTFSIANNSIGGTLPSSYSTWSLLRVFNVSSNELEGPIPPTYAAWTNVEVVDASNNLLNGTLPSGYSAWTKVWVVFLNNNQLGGSLPSSYAAWSGVYYVHFSYNRMSGTIPSLYFSAATGMAALRELMLNDNAIEGSLPSNMFSLPMLSLLALHNNNLRGKLPTWSGTLQLTVITLQGNNNVTGAVPTSWVNMLSPVSFVYLCHTHVCGSSTTFGLTFGFLCLNDGVDLGSMLAEATSTTATAFAILSVSTKQSDIPCAPPLPLPSSAPPLATHGITVVALPVSSAVGSYGAITAAAARGSRAVSSVAVALQASVAATRLRQRCASLDGANNGDDAFLPASDPLDSPTQLQVAAIAGGRAQYAAGAVLGNAALVAAVAGTAHMLATAVRPRVERMAPSAARRVVLVVLDVVVGSDALPGTAARMLGTLMQPSVAAAIVVLAAAPPTGASVVFGAASLAVWVAPAVLVAWRLWWPYRGGGAPAFPLDAVPEVHEASFVTRHRLLHSRHVLLRERLLWWLRERWEWVPRSATGRALLPPYGAFFAGSRGGMRLFELANLAFTVAGGVVLGAASIAEGTADVCAAAVWAPAVLAALTVLQLVLCVALRPSNVAVDNVLCGVAGTLAVASQVASAASDDDTDAADGLNVAIVVVEWVGIALGLAAWVLQYRWRPVAVDVAVVPKKDKVRAAAPRRRCECPPQLAALIQTITNSTGRHRTAAAHGDATPRSTAVLGDAYGARHGALAQLVEQITNMARVQGTFLFRSSFVSTVVPNPANK